MPASTPTFPARAAALALTAVLLGAPQAHAEDAPPACAQDGASVLFVGNSYLFGSTSPLRYYRADTVADLYETGFGGVPALFGVFADQAGLELEISHALSSGFGLHDHVEAGLDRFAAGWDCAALQSLSMLDRERPGDPGRLVEAAETLSEALVSGNPETRITLIATWARADYVHGENRPWSGQGLEAMTADIRAGYGQAAGAIGAVEDIAPVGEAWLAAIGAGLAVENPYEGVPHGKIDLWGYDHHHASAHGYYLEALVLFARLTGLDPRSLGETELGAWELGIAPDVAAGLQDAAWRASGRDALEPFTPAPASQWRPGRMDVDP